MMVMLVFILFLAGFGLLARRSSDITLLCLDSTVNDFHTISAFIFSLTKALILLRFKAGRSSARSADGGRGFYAERLLTRPHSSRLDLFPHRDTFHP